MIQTEHSILQELTAIFEKRQQSAQERVETARDERMKRYYKGQVDALKIAIRDVDTAKFERGLELTLEAGEPEPSQEVLIPEPPQETPAPEPRRKAATREPRPKVEKKKRVSAPAPQPSYMYKALADDALARGVIKRNISWFYHDLLPDGHVKGSPALNAALEANAAFRQAIQAACAAPQALPEIVAANANVASAAAASADIAPSLGQADEQ